ARTLRVVGSQQADEIVLAAEGLEIKLADQGVELRADRAVLWGDRDLLELVRPSADTPTDPLRFGPELPPAPQRAPLRSLRRDDPRAAAITGLREIYAEGHVALHESVAGGEGRIVLADRLYQHLLERRGL